jgi:hypothetical protein
MTRNACRHYRGTFNNNSCHDGVNYVDLAGEGPGIIGRLPCFDDHITSVVCVKRVFPTQEEVDEFQEVAKQHAKIMAVAVRLCRESAVSRGFKVGGDSLSGRVVCPKCNQMLNYNVAGSNGHLWGHCETPGCLSWMQ